MNRLYLAVALAAIAFPAYSQAPSSSQAPGTKQKAQAAPSAATQQFVEKVANSDMFEIQSSKLALDKSQNPEIEDFAQQIIDDHTKASNEMKSIVGNIQGLQVPKQMDSEHKKMMDQLRSASDIQFNQQYRNQQIEVHDTAVQLFTSYSKNGDNAELQSFAEKTLPTLREHLKMAKDLPLGTAAPRVGEAPRQDQKRAGQTGQQDRQQTAQTGQTRGASQQKQRPIAAPAPNQLLGSDLRGSTVYGANNENVGDVRDILLDREGRVVAIIVGVGGFLGIGEKDVAIPFNALEIAAQREGGRQQGAQDGAMQPDRIVLQGMTRQDLEAAPSFNTDAGAATRNQNQNQNRKQNR